MRKGQATLELTLVLVAMLALLFGIVRIAVWFNQDLAGRQESFLNSRVLAADRQPGVGISEGSLRDEGLSPYTTAKLSVLKEEDIPARPEETAPTLTEREIRDPQKAIEMLESLRDQVSKTNVAAAGEYLGSIDAEIKKMREDPNYYSPLLVSYGFTNRAATAAGRGRKKLTTTTGENSGGEEEQGGEEETPQTPDPVVSEETQEAQRILAEAQAEIDAIRAEAEGEVDDAISMADMRIRHLQTTIENLRGVDIAEYHYQQNRNRMAIDEREAAIRETQEEMNQEQIRVSATLKNMQDDLRHARDQWEADYIRAQMDSIISNTNRYMESQTGQINTYIDQINELGGLMGANNINIQLPSNMEAHLARDIEWEIRDTNSAIERIYTDANVRITGVYDRVRQEITEINARIAQQMQGAGQELASGE